MTAAPAVAPGAPAAWHRSRPRWAMLTFVLALLVGIAGAAMPPALARVNTPAAPAAPPAPPSDEALLSRYQLGAGDLGYILFDPSDGQVLASRAADQAFIPASVNKVPTTVAALGILGPDYRFETSLYLTGAVQGGALSGDVILRGGGDPALTSDELLVLVRQLRALGVSRIGGQFRYDSSFIGSATRIDPIQPEAATYNPGVSALSLNHNVIRAMWRRTSRGAVEITATSDTDTLRVPADWVGFDPAPPARAVAPFVLADAGPQSEHWLMSPRLAARGETWLPVGDAGRNAAMVFRRLCSMNGITLPEPVLGTVPEGATLVGQHRSRPLPELERSLLRYSNNLSAELVGLVAARHLTGQALSLQASSAVLSGWLQERAQGATWTGYHTENHSGLSSDGRASPAQMMAILRLAWQQRFGDWGYVDLLPHVPISGEEPAAAPPPRRGRARAAPAAAGIMLRAKTGTMSYARGLAGFLTTASGRELGFAVFVSDIARRQALDTARENGDDDPPGARAWLGRARAVEASLIRRWVATH